MFQSLFLRDISFLLLLNLRELYATYFVAITYYIIHRNRINLQRLILQYVVLYFNLNTGLLRKLF